jgi:undecaprenyl phosphate N,N'-diacetylbacillosamine 1-phosphate transferase
MKYRHPDEVLNAPPPRLLDIFLGLIASILLVVFTPLVALAIKIDSRGPVFYHQKRLGRLGKVFTVRKFRTMQDNAPDLFQADGSRYLAKNDARITKVGKLLRLGFDELPQLANIVRGEMSFIGPRPDDAFAYKHYEGVEWLKLASRPGLTGLAQVSGRNELPWHDRIKYDIYYYYNRTAALDAAIVFRTLTMLLGVHLRSPVVAEATVEEFLKHEFLSEHATKVRDISLKNATS